MTLGITTLFHYAGCRCAECHVLFVAKLNEIMLSVVMLTVVMLTVVMLTVVMLTVVMLNVVMLSVVSQSPLLAIQIFENTVQKESKEVTRSREALLKGKDQYCGPP
jgi:hypothetical protein